jgi:uncharacterized membrane protein
MKKSYSPSPGVDLVIAALVSLMFLASASLWSTAPESIPVHWNLQGDVDRYGGKFEGLMLLPLIAVGISLLLRFIPAMDPKKENFAQFGKVYSIIRVAVTLLMAVIHVAILGTVLGFTIDMGLAVSLGVGSLLIVLGNFMGKIRPNWFVGVRTPWTLSSKKSWVKTHRMSGWLFILMGLAVVATGLTQSKYALGIMLALVLGGSLWAVIYSWLVWRGDTERVSALESRPDNSDSGNGATSGNDHSSKIA